MIMSRKEELLQIVGDDKALAKLVDEIIFLETQLDYLKTLPQINVNPNNPAQQKATPAAKQYKEFLQQYTNCIKILAHISGDDGEKDVSPLRKWAAKYVDTE